MILFKVKAKYDKTLDSGLIKTVTEDYLVEAETWGEAEEIGYKELESYVSGEFGIVDIALYKTEKVLDNIGSRFFKVHLAYIVLDAKTGAEKRTMLNMLVQADDIDTAKQCVVDDMKGTMIDYEIPKIEEVNIQDIFLKEDIYLEKDKTNNDE